MFVAMSVDKYMTNQRDVECAKAGLVQKFIPDDRWGHQPTVIWVKPDEPVKAEQK
jgi:hypothetical protein